MGGGGLWFVFLPRGRAQGDANCWFGQLFGGKCVRERKKSIGQEKGRKENGAKEGVCVEEGVNGGMFTMEP